MELTMSERKAVTKTIATRHRRVNKDAKKQILDELCATTGWHREHAPSALRSTLRATIVKPRPPRTPKYGPKVDVA